VRGLDLGSTAELVPDGCGIKIQPVNRPEIVRQISAAIEWVADDPSAARATGEAARAHVLRERTWDRVGEEIGRAYAEAVRGGS